MKSLPWISSVFLSVLVSACSANAAEPPGDPEVIRTFIDRPPDTVRKTKRFEPEAEPTPEEVREIAVIEQERWGGPSLLNRIACESGFRWNAQNGPYRGLLQISSWWETTAWAATPRDVTLREVRHEQKRTWLVTVYADGSRDRERYGTKEVRVIIAKRGKLPGDASPFHGWAAIRVGQRAVSGDGPTTAWSCGL